MISENDIRNMAAAESRVPVGYLRGESVVYYRDRAGIVRAEQNGLASIDRYVSQDGRIGLPTLSEEIKPKFDSELRVLLQKLHEQLPKGRDSSFYEGCSFVMGYLEDEFGTENK